MIRIIDPVKVEAIIMQFIDKKCIEFRPSLRTMAKKVVRGIFKKNNVQKHDDASTILMALSLKTSNPVLEKVKNNIVHTWGVLDEF